ncbi:hypothetical protein Tco_0372216, partial [Tanacetum coccineum]
DHLQQLGHDADSTSMVDQLPGYMETEIANDVKAEKDMMKLYDELRRSFKARGELITELEKLRALGAVKGLAFF